MNSSKRGVSTWEENAGGFIEVRGLIEEAGRQAEELRPHYESIFFKLTELGCHEVIRQHLHFAPEQVELSLPGLVREIREAIERYGSQYGFAPRVEIRGAVVHEGYKAKISDWQPIVAYDETHNLLALQSKSGEQSLVWISPSLVGSLAGYGKLRLRPEPDEKI